MGPIRRQADAIMGLLRSPRTAVHLVTLLEEMPVQETVDAVAELRGLHIPVGAVVVNQTRHPALDDAPAPTSRCRRIARRGERSPAV